LIVVLPFFCGGGSEGFFLLEFVAPPCDLDDVSLDGARDFDFAFS